MLYSYKPVNYKIKEVQDLIAHLVIDIWCKPDKTNIFDRLPKQLQDLYNEYDWFKAQSEEIYKVCMSLDAVELKKFSDAFENNNQIEKLCSGLLKPIYISSLHSDLHKNISVFFSELYTKFLGWKLVYDVYNKKKAYYDELITKNSFVECPCCGYGDIKTQYSKGHSPFDHYLPQKHYPFSAVNFDNLVPICHMCNSDYKGETDILKNGQKVFYPFAKVHPKIKISVNFDTSLLAHLIDDNNPTLPLDYFSIAFNLNTAETISWNKIFKIKERYAGKIADFRVSWFRNVTTQYSKYSKRMNGYTVLDAFDDIVEDDSNKSLGFLKSPYLLKLKSYSPLIKAIQEVSGTSIIN